MNKALYFAAEGADKCSNDDMAWLNNLGWPGAIAVCVIVASFATVLCVMFWRG